MELRVSCMQDFHISGTIGNAKSWVFGEAQGYSTKRVSKLIRDAITDYDRQVDPAAVHRVVHGYLKIGTETRASLEVKVQLN